MSIETDLRKISFMNDIGNVLDDIELLLKDYDYDIDQYDDEDISYESTDIDVDIRQIILAYTQSRHIVDKFI